jgi:hypothetical protein
MVSKNLVKENLSLFGCENAILLWACGTVSTEFKGGERDPIVDGGQKLTRKVLVIVEVMQIFRPLKKKKSKSKPSR